MDGGTKVDEVLLKSSGVMFPALVVLAATVPIAPTRAVVASNIARGSHT